MKRLLTLAVASLLCALYAQAAEIKVEVKLAEDQDSDPTDTFTPDVPEIFAFFTATGSAKGDKFRGVWIADDVGDAAPKNTKIDEYTLTADEDDFAGSFSLSKPNDGWPEGNYHIDIYAGHKLAISVKFNVKEQAKSEESKSDSKENSSDD